MRKSLRLYRWRGKFAATGGDVSKVASVASFFISRIDSLVDSLIGDQLKKETDAARKAKLQGILGKIASRMAS